MDFPRYTVVIDVFFYYFNNLFDVFAVKTLTDGPLKNSPLQLKLFFSALSSSLLDPRSNCMHSLGYLSPGTSPLSPLVTTFSASYLYPCTVESTTLLRPECDTYMDTRHLELPRTYILSLP